MTLVNLFNLSEENQEIINNIDKQKKIQEKREFNKQKNKFESGFYRLMFEFGLCNKYKDTYCLSILNKTNYGFFTKLYLEPGLSYREFQKFIYKIEENLCCLLILDYKKFDECAGLRIITEPLDENLEYENPKIRAYQMYLGLNFSLNTIINNNHEHCMFLISGATGAGKTRFIGMILLSWILSCKPREVEIYLSDCAKNEYNNFQYVKHVKYYASELEELNKMMKYIKIKLEKRKKVLSKYRERGTATDIKEYNQINKSKMSICYVIIDEVSVIMPDNTDSKEEKQVKQEILDILKQLYKIGRNHGIFPLVATQKTVKDELPSVVKNMSAVRVSFRANDAISSEVILGNDAAVGIMDRYAIYSQNGGSMQDYLFSPLLTTERLNELLKPYVDRSRGKIDVDYEISMWGGKNDNKGNGTVNKKVSNKENNNKQHYPTYNSVPKGDEIDEYDDYR